MRDDEGFEIDRAYDLLPHVVGASWATIWFRMNRIRRPSQEEFRRKVAEYFKILDPLITLYPQNENFKEMIIHIKNRHQEEMDRILGGKNQEIEKRFKRYIEYG
ncbi:MAG: hypothetical protein E6K98_06380 [Thaumarchaeota archaeon]|nr:MAG: hypothetical protein E6K98_06380 [Nitrososphaerota archaeon]TLX96319.1 MAG: hypothetical protein E6K91_00625 [Nitrososphaerota archaeon]